MASSETVQSRRRSRRLQYDRKGHLELELNISPDEALSRLKDAVSVERWWTLDSFAHKPIIGYFRNDGVFQLRKSPKLDNATQELTDLINRDGLPNRPRPTLWGRFEAATDGCRLVGDLQDGVPTGWFLWILLAALDVFIIWQAIQMRQLLFAAVAIPVLDGFMWLLTQFVRMLYWSDRDLLTQFVDAVFADVRPAPAATQRRYARRVRSASS